MSGWLDDNLGYLLYVAATVVVFASVDFWLRFASPRAKFGAPVWWAMAIVVGSGWILIQAAGRAAPEQVVEFLLAVTLAFLAVGGVLLARRRVQIERLVADSANLRTALEAVPFDLWVLDASGQPIFLNTEARRHGGSDGMGLLPEDRADREFANRRALKGEIVRGEVTSAKGEDQRHCYRVIVPVRKGPKIVGAVGAQLDITSRVEADEALRRSEEKLALHVRHTPMPVIEWNLAFGVTAWNPAAERLFGYSLTEALGRHAVGFIVPESARSQMNRVWAALLAHKGGTRTAVENVTKGGRTIHCEWYNTPLVDDTGAVIGVATSVQDDTEREILQKQLHQAQKMESIGQLAGGVAHEFNNLLTPMLMQTDLVVQTYAHDPRLMDLVKPVQTAIHQASELNRRILALGRRNPEQREPLLLNPLVENALALLRPSLDRRIEFTISLADKLEPLLLDRAYVTQIVMNLALNARDTLLEKLSRDPPAGWIPQLRVTTERVKDAVRREAASAMPFTLSVQRLTVTDNGLGIPAEIRGRIFEPFFTTKPTGSGTGLGLAVVWNVVHNLGGWIEVDEGPHGEGTRFQISIPETPSVTAAVSSPATTSTITKLGQKSMRPLKILIAEDNSLVAETFAAVLGTAGHEVLVAQDGEEAWEFFSRRSTRFDALLADYNMPRVSGGELLRRVKQGGFQGRVIIVSGYLTSEKVDELIRHGADGVLRKPFSPSELFGVLEGPL